MTEPIDRFVKDSSSDSFFGNGFWSIVNLTNTATPIEVAAKVLNTPPTHVNVLEIKQVTIGYEDETNEIPEMAKYTAILLSKGVGKRVLLIQYFADKQSSGWVYRFYDVK